MNDLKLNQVLDVVGIIEYPKAADGDMDAVAAFDEPDFSGLPIVNALIARRARLDEICEPHEWNAVKTDGMQSLFSIFLQLLGFGAKHTLL